MECVDVLALVLMLKVNKMALVSFIDTLHLSSCMMFWTRMSQRESSGNLKGNCHSQLLRKKREGSWRVL